MNLQNNCFENLINSFKIVCSSLEKRAEFNLKQLEKECEDDFASSVESLRMFNEIISGISETCAEVVSNSEILKSAVKSNMNGNAINLPYGMHADVVKCINELYIMRPLERDSFGEKFLDERNKSLITDLIKVGKRNVHDVKDIENTIVEAREMF